MAEPTTKRTIAFVDGQNLFNAVKEVFGYDYPNYDVKALATAICTAKGWQLAETRFYTGLPDPKRDFPRSVFWVNKLRDMRQQNILTYSRPLRYRSKTVILLDKTDIDLPDNSKTSLPAKTKITVDVAEEKGIDVRLALDVIRLAHKGLYDVALIFSQDQDLSEAADEIREIAKEQGRWIKIASAFPEGGPNRRGINRTDWCPFDKTLYDACRDPKNYRLKTL